MPLKTWDRSNDWCDQLSPSTTVCIADTDVGAGSKPWWIYVAQTTHRPIRTNLSGKFNVLLTEEEARGLVQYLLDMNLLVLNVRYQLVEVNNEGEETEKLLNERKFLREINRARRKNANHARRALQPKPKTRRRRAGR